MGIAGVHEPRGPGERGRAGERHVGDGAQRQDAKTAHLDRDLGGTEPVAAAQHGPAHTGVGLDSDFGAGHEPSLERGEGETAQTVAARLGAAPVRVAQLHADVAT